MNAEGKGSTQAASGWQAWLARLADAPRRFRQFLHEVRQEMGRVTWPGKDDVKATTMVVIVTVFFFGFFLFVVDQVLILAVERILKFKP